MERGANEKGKETKVGKKSRKTSSCSAREFHRVNRGNNDGKCDRDEKIDVHAFPFR